MQVAVHASGHAPRDAAAACEREPFRGALARLGLDARELPSGAVVGVVTVTACLPTPEVRDLIPWEERELGDFGPGRWAWRLTDAVALPNPVRARGTLGLWDLGWDVEKAVLLQFEAAGGKILRP